VTSAGTIAAVPCNCSIGKTGRYGVALALDDGNR